MPEIPQSLGCERSRGNDGYKLEKLALIGGINRMAVQSDRALTIAQELGLRTYFQKTCCSWQLLEHGGDRKRSQP